MPVEPINEEFFYEILGDSYYRDLEADPSEPIAEEVPKLPLETNDSP